MSITIENPTAEEIIAELKRQIAPSEFERLKVLLNDEHPETAEEEENAWREISARSAARFFEEEEA